MTAHNWFHSSRKSLKKKPKQTAIHFRRSSRWLQRISPRGTRWKKSSWLRLQRSRPGMLSVLRSMSVMLNSFITHTTQWSTWSVDHWTGSGKDGWNCKSPHHTVQGYYIITSIRVKAQHEEAELLRPKLPGKLWSALKMVMERYGLVGWQKSRESFYIKSMPDKHKKIIFFFHRSLASRKEYLVSQKDTLLQKCWSVCDYDKILHSKLIHIISISIDKNHHWVCLGWINFLPRSPYCIVL